MSNNTNNDNTAEPLLATNSSEPEIKDNKDSPQSSVDRHTHTTGTTSSSSGGGGSSHSLRSQETLGISFSDLPSSQASSAYQLKSSSNNNNNNNNSNNNNPSSSSENNHNNNAHDATENDGSPMRRVETAEGGSKINLNKLLGSSSKLLQNNSSNNNTGTSTSMSSVSTNSLLTLLNTTTKKDNNNTLSPNDASLGGGIHLRSPGSSMTDEEEMKSMTLQHSSTTTMGPPDGPEDEEAMNLIALRSDFDELVRFRGSGMFTTGRGGGGGGSSSGGTAGATQGDDGDIAESIPSATFYEACFSEYFRIRSYRVAAWFFAFVVVLCIILFVNRVDFAANSAAYFSQLGALNIMEHEKFENINEITEVYDWMRTVVRNLQRARDPQRWNYSAATPYPMSLLLVRQVRGSATYCTAANTIFTGLRQRVCLPDGVITDIPFGPVENTELYKANGQLPTNDIVRAQTLNGVYVGLSDQDYIYERHFYFEPAEQAKQSSATTTTTAAPAPATSTTTTTIAAGNITTASASSSSSTSPVPTTTSSIVTTTDIPIWSSKNSIVGTEEMYEEINAMWNNSFINGSTWTVAFDVAFVHPALRDFTVLTMMLERLPSGDLKSTIEPNTFMVTKLSVDEFASVVTFCSDLFICVFFVFCVVELLTDIYARIHLSRNRWVVVWDSIVPVCITILQIAALSSVLFARFSIWSTLSDVTSSIDGSTSTEFKARQTLHGLSQVSSYLTSSYRFFGLSILLCLVRLLIFSESLDGLNMLSRAIRLNGTELLTVLILSGCVVVMFAVAGNVFFDDELIAYATVPSTFSSLTRALSSSGTEPWMELAESSPRQAFVFFMLFWLTLWIVLLNMVLAIVVSAVDAVQRAAQDGVKFDTTWEVLKRHVLLLGGFYSGCRISGDAVYRGGAAVAVAAAGTTMPLPFSMRYAKWTQDYQTRYSAAENAKAWVAAGNKEVHVGELNLVLNAIPLYARKMLYQVACTTYYTNKALEATRSKTAEEIEGATRGLEKQLAVLEKKLDLAAPKKERRSIVPTAGDNNSNSNVDAKSNATTNATSSSSNNNDNTNNDPDDSEDEDSEEVKRSRMKSALKSNGGVAEMLHVTGAQSGFFANQ